MPTLIEKRTELEAIKARAQGIIDQNKAGLTPEHNLTLSALLSKAGELKGEIESEQALDAKKADLADLDKFLNESVQTS